MNYIELRNLNFELKTNNDRKYVPVDKDKQVFIYATTEDTTPFNSIVGEHYDYLIDTLNRENNVSVIIHKTEGTTTDYVIVKNKCFSGIREARAWLKTINRDCRKYEVYDYNDK